MVRVLACVMVLAMHPCVLLAQQSSAPNDSAASWDNLLFVGTRAAYATGAWRLSGEFQARFKNKITMDFI